MFYRISPRGKSLGARRRGRIYVYRLSVGGRSISRRGKRPPVIERMHPGQQIARQKRNCRPLLKKEAPFSLGRGFLRHSAFKPPMKPRPILSFCIFPFPKTRRFPALSRTSKRLAPRERVSSLLYPSMPFYREIRAFAPIHSGGERDSFQSRSIRVHRAGTGGARALYHVRPLL